MCIKPGIIIVQLLLSVQNLDVGGRGGGGENFRGVVASTPWIHPSSPFVVRFQANPTETRATCLHSKPLTRPCFFGAVAAGALAGVRALLDLLKAVR